MATTEHQLDPISGQTTTGHEWDGIRELNTPLPRWWLWTFYATILFAVLYWLVYPAWPLVSGFTGGLLGYSNRGQVAQDLDDIKSVRASMEGGLAQRERHRNRGGQEAARARARAWQGGLRRELRALPRLGRAGRQGLSQPHQRRLAVGRHARRDPDHDHPRHPRRL